jgi:hypothetical protein
MTSDPSTIDYHEARLLILLGAFGKGISSLTKLAKLDFLLRYPTMLEQLLKQDGIPLPDALVPRAIERFSVESPMIRYKYGPWDDQYYAILGSLISKALIDTKSSGRNVQFKLSDRGREIAESFSSEPAWSTIAARAGILHRHYDKTGNALKDRIYAEFPEVMDRPHRSRIGIR